MERMTRLRVLVDEDASLPKHTQIPPESARQTDSLTGDGILKEEFEKAMGGDFDFEGSFAYGDAFPDAPNPCLSIEGIGTVGLPLSSRDAQLLITRSAQAPYGHNDQTIIDKKVRDTWEIEPSKIVFENPAWDKFVQTQMLTTVTRALGTLASRTHCELYKLLLYQEGSHFHRHQDTAKVPGMFATVIILLPSAHSGGQVHVSHSTSSKTFDFSTESRISTAVLAWYTDVFHEVKPVTSGYRLALSYNLIQDPSLFSTPRLPDMNASATELTHVLKNWRARSYRKGSYMDHLVFILGHQYSTSELDRGLVSLKGADAHKLGYLSKAAEELGYDVFLGELEHHLQGPAADDGSHYFRTGKYYSDDSDDDDDSSDDASESDDETPEMLEVYERDLYLSHLVDLDGHEIDCSCLHLDEDNLVPEDPFSGAKPDDTEYEGYMGNGAGSLDQYYHRTAVLIMHQDDAMDILFEADAAGSYGYYRLQKSITALSAFPTPDDVKLANVVIDRLFDHQKDKLRGLLSFAVRWKDHALWKRLVESLEYDISIDGELTQALEAFKFNLIRDVFKKFIMKAKTLSAKLDKLDTLRSITGVKFPLIQAWTSAKRDDILSTLKTPAISDISALIKTIQAYSTSWFNTKILPTIVKTHAMYSFWAAFTRRLYVEKATLPHSPNPQMELAEAFPLCIGETLVDQCLETVITLWEVQVVPEKSPPPGLKTTESESTSSKQVARILDILDLCVYTNRITYCRVLFTDVLKKLPPTSETFATVYKPLILEMRQLFEKTGVSICSPAFTHALQALIGSYLHHVLRAGPEPLKMVSLGCTCVDCKQVNTFLESDLELQSIELTKSVRKHVIGSIESTKGMKDLMAYEAGPRAPRKPLILKKSKELLATRSWEKRQVEARAFLGCIGDNDTIGQIMGARYEDVGRAVEGGKLFALPVRRPLREKENQVQTSMAGESKGPMPGKKRTRSLEKRMSLWMEKLLP